MSGTAFVFMLIGVALAAVLPFRVVDLIENNSKRKF